MNGAPDRRQLVPRIIHAAMLGSIAVYYVVTLVVPPHTPAAEPALAAALGFAALGSTVFAFLAPRIVRPPPGKEATPAVEFTRSILRWALAESVAIYGLVLALLGAPLGWYLPFFGWSVALLVIFSPWLSGKPPVGGPLPPPGL